MIYGFGIENFLSIRNYQYIDLRVPPNVPREPTRLVPIFDGAVDRAPLVVAIFGPNGSGKSNVLRALSFLFSFVKDSFQWSAEQPFAFTKFLENGASNSPTRLTLDFGGPETVSKPALAQCPYIYELVLESTQPPVVLRETLSYRPRRSRRLIKLFDRESDKISTSTAFDLSPSVARVVNKILRPNASIISTLAQVQHPFAQMLKDAASAVTSNIGIVKLEQTDDSTVGYYQQDETLLRSLNRELSRLDVGIKNAGIANGPSGPFAQFEHDGLSHPIPSYFESHGTRQFYRLFPFINWTLSNGGIAILDELDLAIHALLLPEIVGWFQDEERNPHKAQLWMTCQSATLLEFLTKEEIFFCEKDGRGQTSVFGLRDIKGVRRVDNYYQKYLGGVYGAVPRVG